MGQTDEVEHSSTWTEEETHGPISAWGVGSVQAKLQGMTSTAVACPSKLSRVPSGHLLKTVWTVSSENRI